MQRGNVVTKARQTKLDILFVALSDPVRRAVIRELVKRPRRAGELARQLFMSAPALSRHLRVLRRAGLIVETAIAADARVRVYRVKLAAFNPMRKWLAQIQS